MKAEILTGARSPEPAPDAVPLAQSMAALRMTGHYECVDTLIGHSDEARLRRPAERSLGSSFAVPERPAHLSRAGAMRRGPAGRPRRLRVRRQVAHRLGPDRRQFLPAAHRTLELRASPASGRAVPERGGASDRRSPSPGIPLICLARARRWFASRSCRTAASSPGPTTIRSSSGTRPTAAASARSPATRAGRVSGVRSRRLRATRSLGSSFAVPERLAHLPRARAQVYCVAVLPDGRVVSGCSDESLIVWDPTDGRRLRTLIGHSSCARHRRPTVPSPSRAEPRIVVRRPRAPRSSASRARAGVLCRGPAGRSRRLRV